MWSCSLNIQQNHEKINIQTFLFSLIFWHAFWVYFICLIRKDMNFFYWEWQFKTLFHLVYLKIKLGFCYYHFKTEVPFQESITILHVFHKSVSPSHLIDKQDELLPCLAASPLSWYTCQCTTRNPPLSHPSRRRSGIPPPLAQQLPHSEITEYHSNSSSKFPPQNI